ncbi:MAG: hypothetical protein ACI86S_001642, partial [Paracoccaceae bacterium]
MPANPARQIATTSGAVSMKDDPHRHPFRRSGEDRETVRQIPDT